MSLFGNTDRTFQKENQQKTSWEISYRRNQEPKNGLQNNVQLSIQNQFFPAFTHTITENLTLCNTILNHTFRYLYLTDN